MAFVVEWGVRGVAPTHRRRRVTTTELGGVIVASNRRTEVNRLAPSVAGWIAYFRLQVSNGRRQPST